MKHLVVGEMIDFVSIDKLDNESLTLAKKVNAHIMNCDVCRKRVAAFQRIYDELVRIGKSGELSDAIKEAVSKKIHIEIVEKKELEDYM